ncbi:MAG: DUF1294 domain-containing protein [Dokdonella sp.]|jgi:uncharacterized membrane protein YsdA (DUF1294 family)/cold shock CspA family protein|uniref:DUF1294 domain-containing protein n=1 Tax=Dokdonella sp. TaxID=2291710 RepID=UPI0025B9C1FF|nr:DUF1294 domain-containing protein [Dokdonella sp.]MBK8122952.1 DUF1294 domain-containing protein [Dokdonella sp.]HPW04644.1 DUF1294 domain-containing protein [Dokdonella sp.]HQV48863.1 DUF1294 domain-containing protein [Dokdonella sp.]HQX34150.1 DUF1294 domain-containing protein [Dokdonella sp.]
MRRVGRINGWKDDKGFGFVEPNGGGARAFVHIRAFEKRSRRPIEGDLISYHTMLDDRRRLNAVKVRLVTGESDESPARGSVFPRRTAGFLALAACAFAAWSGRLPIPVAALYFAMSVIAFGAYGLDKSAARKDRWRTQESTLHLLELLGGWPGALIAQGSFRHKTRKLSFQITFWFMVAINLGVLAWLLRSGMLEVLLFAIRQL